MYIRDSRRLESTDRSISSPVAMSRRCLTSADMVLYNSPDSHLQLDGNLVYSERQREAQYFGH